MNNCDVTAMPQQRILCLWWPFLKQEAGGPGSGGLGGGSLHSGRSVVDIRLLAAWCRQYSPRVGLEEAQTPDALMLDITGCSHLFGGEHRLAAQIAEDFRRRGLTTRAGVADTIGAAWAAAHHGTRPTAGARPLSGVAGCHHIPPGRQREALSPLPVEALRLPPHVVELLHEFDLRTIGQVRALPRSSVPARFGPLVLRRLDQALGELAETIQPVPPIEPIRARWPFESPTDDRRTIEQVLRHLLVRIVERLQARQEGVQRLRVRLAGARPVEFSVGLLRPAAEAEHLCELVFLHLERAPIESEISGVSVEVLVAAPLGIRPQPLFENDAGRLPRRRELALLIDRLSSRLGAAAVLKPRLSPELLPEWAVLCEPWIFHSARRPAAPAFPQENAASPGSGPAGQGPAPCWEAGLFRPLCVMPRPVAVAAEQAAPGGPPARFEWGGKAYTLADCRGPERIETGWWRGGHVRRDYYRAEAVTGERFWLYRQRSGGRWFLHGMFG